MTTTLVQHGLARPDRLTPWCSTCPLRYIAGFEELCEADLVIMEEFKRHHGRAWAGAILLDQGSPEPRLFTLFSGWAVKYWPLRSGERQLLEVLLPGDLVGLESVLCGASQHSVEAVTDVTFCVFDPNRLDELWSISRFAKRIAKLQALDQRRMAARLAMIGACDARRNLAAFMLDLYSRLLRRQMAQNNTFKLPLSLQQLADALGLTTVHVHRLLHGFRQENLFTLQNHSVHIHDAKSLRVIAAMPEFCGDTRPLL